MEAEDENSGSLHDRLGDTAIKIRAMAYLIENLGSDEAPPLDMDEVFLGIGEILAGLAKEVKTVSRELEDTDLKRKQKR